MSARRVLKAAEAIRQVVSTAILTELRDPRIAGVTVTYVEVSADLRHAKVHVSVMGDEKAQTLCIKGLESAGGFLQRKVGDRIETRYTPRLQFILDKGVKHSADVVKILEEVLPKPEEDPTSETPDLIDSDSIDSELTDTETVESDPVAEPESESEPSAVAETHVPSEHEPSEEESPEQDPKSN